MKKIIPLLLVLAILFSGCTSQKAIVSSSDLPNDSSTDTEENIDSSTEDTTSTDNEANINNTSENASASGKASTHTCPH